MSCEADVSKLISNLEAQRALMPVEERQATRKFTNEADEAEYWEIQKIAACFIDGFTPEPWDFGPAEARYKTHQSERVALVENLIFRRDQAFAAVAALGGSQEGLKRQRWFFGEYDEEEVEFWKDEMHADVRDFRIEVEANSLGLDSAVGRWRERQAKQAALIEQLTRERDAARSRVDQTYWGFQEGHVDLVERLILERDEAWAKIAGSFGSLEGLTRKQWFDDDRREVTFRDIERIMLQYDRAAQAACMFLGGMAAERYIERRKEQVALVEQLTRERDEARARVVKLKGTLHG